MSQSHAVDFHIRGTVMLSCHHRGGWLLNGGFLETSGLYKFDELTLSESQVATKATHLFDCTGETKYNERL